METCSYEDIRAMRTLVVEEIASEMRHSGLLDATPAHVSPSIAEDRLRTYLSHGLTLSNIQSKEIQAP